MREAKNNKINNSYFFEVFLMWVKKIWKEWNWEESTFEFPNPC